MKKIFKILLLILLILLPLSVIIYNYFSEKKCSIINALSDNFNHSLLLENNTDLSDSKENPAEEKSEFKGTSEGLINATLINFTIPITVKSTWRIKKTGENYKCYLKINVKNSKYNINITKTTSCIGTIDKRQKITFKQPSFNLTAKGSITSKTASGTWTINPELSRDISYKGLPLTLRLIGNGTWSGKSIIDNRSIVDNEKYTPYSSVSSI